MLVLLLVLAPLSGAAKTPKKANVSANFVRVQRDENGPQSLQLAVHRYHAGNATVDLVGAVHVGEKSYYQQLNREFKNYDAVLYELIASSEDAGGRPIPVAGDVDNPLSMVQNGLKNMLGLTFQLDHIDYSPANFVHADISPQEFEKSMQKKGESFRTIFMRLLQAGMDSPSTVTDEEIAEMDLLGIFLKGPSPRDQIILRRLLADSFSDLDAMGAALEGPGGSTLISVRNQKAMAVLQQQVKKGKKKLAIFYGVAHMPDMSTRLQKLHFQHDGVHWLSAWDLRLKPKTKPAKKG